MFDLTIEVKDQGIKNMLSQVQQKLGDLTPLMKVISETMYATVQKNFMTEGGRLPSGKWQDLAKPTKDQRAKIGKWPGKILQVNRNLLGSITPSYTSTTAVVGSSMPFGTGYAAIHQFGGKAGKGKKVTIPARPYLALNDEDIEDIKDDVRKFLQK